MIDEQRVRTMCGWIGVEIGKSRVRTPGKAGYGLYRVRGAVLRPMPPAWPRAAELAWSEWTAYAFTLDQIFGRVMWAIHGGTPDGPTTLDMAGWDGCRRHDVKVPTRWTSAYTGRRDMGAVQGAVRVDGFEGAETLSGGWEGDDGGSSLSVRGLVERRAAERVAELRRKKAVRAGFARVFQLRRAHGLQARHQAKLNRQVNMSD